MAIRIHLQETETELFCSSKWWGDPDLPADMEYPTVEVTDEDGTYPYPLTFLCQIDCEDIAPLDPEGRLPHQGMFYVFAAIDEYLDYDAPYHNGLGQWDRKMVVVKYTKAINFETFRSAILVDDEDQPLTQKALKMTFEACEDNADGTDMNYSWNCGAEGPSRKTKVRGLSTRISCRLTPTPPVSASMTAAC